MLFAQSVVFYAVCDWKFVFLLLVETSISWLLVRKIAALRNSEVGNKNVTKKWFLIGIGFVLIVLCVFKYFNFFIDQFNLSFSYIVMPLGISYYSFKIISYLSDVYLEKRNSEPSFIAYAVYVLFFPHLICGPIVRSLSITEKIHNGLDFELEKFKIGIVRIITGLFMKTVVADRGGT